MPFFFQRIVLFYRLVYSCFRNLIDSLWKKKAQYSIPRLEHDNWLCCSFIKLSLYGVHITFACPAPQAALQGSSIELHHFTKPVDETSTQSVD